MTPSISAALIVVNSDARIPYLSDLLNNSRMQLIEEIYRARLEMLIEEAGGQKALSERIGKAPSQISQWLNGSKDSKTGKPRNMDRSTARAIEAVFPKPNGWMDQPVDPAARRSTPVADSLGGEVKFSRGSSMAVARPDDAQTADFAAHAERIRKLGGRLDRSNSDVLARRFADALGDVLRALPGAMRARSVDACRLVAEAPDSELARDGLSEILQHSSSLQRATERGAEIDAAFREACLTAFDRAIDKGGAVDEKTRNALAQLRISIEQETADTLGLDIDQARSALNARQSGQG